MCQPAIHWEVLADSSSNQRSKTNGLRKQALPPKQKQLRGPYIIRGRAWGRELLSMTTLHIRKAPKMESTGNEGSQMKRRLGSPVRMLHRILAWRAQRSSPVGAAAALSATAVPTPWTLLPLRLRPRSGDPAQARLASASRQRMRKAALVEPARRCAPGHPSSLPRRVHASRLPRSGRDVRRGASVPRRQLRLWKSSNSSASRSDLWRGAGGCGLGIRQAPRR